MMITYAQNREDVLLQRAFPKGYKGFYVDVGANEPLQDSVTKHFSMHGWRGINLEPHPDLHRKLCDDRPDDVNLNLGVSNRHATLEYLECVSNFGLSTFSPSMAERWRRDEGLEFVGRPIPVRPLAAILDEHARGRTIDFLKVDAEAHEFEVLSGNDWTRWRPRVVLVEATRPELWEPLILEAGYLSAAFDGINLYYVRREEPELLGPFKAPVSCLDACVPYWAYQLLAQHMPSHPWVAQLAPTSAPEAPRPPAPAPTTRHSSIHPPHDPATRESRFARTRRRLSRACKRLTGLDAPSA